MRIGAAIAVALLFACSPSEERVPEPKSSPAAASPAAAAPVTATTAEADFEPPDAQARAEAVLHADFNRDKTTRLEMKMLPLVYTTSEVTGLASTLAAREDSIDDRLTRLGAKVTDTEVVIRLPGAILFDFDSANIRADAERALNDVAQVIGSYAQRPVRIDGHTDSMASDEYNLGLSARRAKAVVDWLAAHGVERARLAANGVGETKPVATNDTPSGRQLNRRVEVVIAK